MLGESSDRRVRDANHPWLLFHQSRSVERGQTGVRRPDHHSILELINQLSDPPARPRQHLIKPNSISATPTRARHQLALFPTQGSARAFCPRIVVYKVRLESPDQFYRYALTTSTNEINDPRTSEQIDSSSRKFSYSLVTRRKPPPVAAAAPRSLDFYITARRSTIYICVAKLMSPSSPLTYHYPAHARMQNRARCGICDARDMRVNAYW